MSTTSQSVQLKDDEYKLDEPRKRRKIIKDDEHKILKLDIREALDLKTKMAKIEKAAECPHYSLKEVEISGYRGHK
ncbi:hypothetical protein GBA52_022450 [Prunus armeniaca]|nr:hypothetical protein GBA52_022450 [Prunus armeniaca]